MQSYMWKMADCTFFASVRKHLSGFTLCPEHHLLCMLAITSIILLVFPDRKWLKNKFQSLVSSRRSAISLKSNRTAAISASRGIITALDAWINDYSFPQIFSLGVVSMGKSSQSGQTHPVKPPSSKIFFNSTNLITRTFSDKPRALRYSCWSGFLRSRDLPKGRVVSVFRRHHH